MNVLWILNAFHVEVVELRVLCNCFVLWAAWWDLLSHFSIML